jgi:hypothetical protein
MIKEIVISLQTNEAPNPKDRFARRKFGYTEVHSLDKELNKKEKNKLHKGFYKNYKQYKQEYDNDPNWIKKGDKK